MLPTRTLLPLAAAESDRAPVALFELSMVDVEVAPSHGRAGEL